MIMGKGKPTYRELYHCEKKCLIKSDNDENPEILHGYCLIIENLDVQKIFTYSLLIEINYRM